MTRRDPEHDHWEGDESFGQVRVQIYSVPAQTIPTAVPVSWLAPSGALIMMAAGLVL